MLFPVGLLLVILAAPVQSIESPHERATVEQAEALRVAGKLSEARDICEKILQGNSSASAAQDEEVAVSEQLALEAARKGDADSALQDLLRAQRFAPESPKLLYDLGVLEDEMKLYQDADKTLAHLEQLEPNAPNVMYAVGRVKLDLGQLAAAEQKMEAYLKVKPEDASAHYGLGRVYRQGLQLERAEAEFKRCIELQPKQTEGYYELGDTELQLDNYADALANFNKTLERNPKHGGALVGIGVAYFKQKQYDKAVEALHRAVSAESDYQPGHYYLGLSLARLGKQDESKHELEIATNLAEKNSKQSANRLRLYEQTP